MDPENAGCLLFKKLSFKMLFCCLFQQIFESFAKMIRKNAEKNMMEGKLHQWILVKTLARNGLWPS